MKKRQAYIGIGTNIAPRSERMQNAINALAKRWTLTAQSSIYITKPVGYTEQPDFLNAVVSLTTDAEPEALLLELKQMEQQLGRKDRERWHEREVDFDLLFLDDMIVHTSALKLPHPEALRRIFVLVPLIEIAGSMRDPQSGKPIIEHLAFVPFDPEQIRMLGADEVID
jgi:2-amino-4-hydroxy-6-hydroxymethyldihydropteridine diphosphokinase